MGIHILLNEYTERECVYIQRRSMGILFEQMDIHIHLNVYTPLKQMSIPFETMCIHITHPSTPATISASLRGGASRGDVPRHRGWTRLSSCSPCLYFAAYFPHAPRPPLPGTPWHHTCGSNKQGPCTPTLSLGRTQTLTRLHRLRIWPGIVRLLGVHLQSKSFG